MISILNQHDPGSALVYNSVVGTTENREISEDMEDDFWQLL